MIVEIEKCRNCDIPHRWLYNEPTLMELRRIKQLTGWTARGLETALEETEPEAFAALLDLLHRREGIEIPFEQIDLDFDGFDMKPDKEEEEADPQIGQQGEPGKPLPAANPTGNGLPQTAESTDNSAAIPPAFGGTSA